ncbi:MAG: alpha/beta hydrolase, partial [Gammaproteobacteria bacterium]|nr:alpha/beta hydrolase [Gammaproteobacteria bacterium]
MQPKTLQLESQKISYYESDGTGQAVMLVHGNSSSGRVFRHQLESEFGRKYRVVAIDLPGHGNSDPAEQMETYSLPYYASIVATAAEALQMEDAVFIGWSLGGHAVLQAQASLPQAAGFVIFGTPPLRFPPAMEEAFLPHPAMAAAFNPELTQEEAAAFGAAFFAPDSPVDPAPFVDDILATDGNARAGLAASLAASLDPDRAPG